jgi:hypothetical protein
VHPSVDTQGNEGLRYPEWQKPYQQALLEHDEKKLKERIAAVEAAISNRLRAITGDANHHAERQAIEDALSLLRILKNTNR